MMHQMTRRIISLVEEEYRVLIHRKVRLCDLLLRSPNKRQSLGLGGRTSSICMGFQP